MQTYIILSRFNEGASAEPKTLKDAAAKVSQRVKEECPEINWKSSFALMGAFDVVDIVESDSPEAVAKAALLIRTHGHAQTETMLATRWDDFVASL